MAWKTFVLSESSNRLLDVVLALAIIISTVFSICLFTAPAQYDPYTDNSKKITVYEEDPEDAKDRLRKRNEEADFRSGRTIQVVVLGDIGRSPRMQYHALSIAEHRGRVYLIGYRDSEIHPAILSNPRIHIVPLRPAPAFLRSSSKLLFPVIAPLKALWQARSLYLALSYRTPPARWMLVQVCHPNSTMMVVAANLVQNPPSIPTLAIAKIACFLRNTELVIDWHNFGYSILALKLGPGHLLVKVSAIYEKICARLADSHITVTNAMARVLKDEYGVTALPLHDRPAALFRPIDSQERAQFLARLPDTSQYALDLALAAKNPWKLIVSSTSWTADEDFSVLLDALCAYSTQATSRPQLPKILVIITGKGPLKEHYLAKIQQLNQEKRLLNVIIRTAWLTPEDYALLLAAADLGISLHTSSSGVDLPMKVVDMFGAGLPVVGWGKFEAWPELVKEDVNGKGFESPEQLTEQLVELFGARKEALSTLKNGAVKESQNRWDDEWDRVGKPLFKFNF